MKTAVLLFVMIITLLQAATLAAEVNRAQQEADADRRPSRAVARPKPKSFKTASYSKSTKNHRERSAVTRAGSSSRTAAPAGALSLEHPGSIPSNVAPNKAISHRSLPAHPSAASVNGQQFRNSRNPGARLAASGGPSAAARGTAVISGNNMKRKP
jgi:hypothetical protein